ncbi:MAG: tRNA adenosine deaminase-associated protein [Corynebacterium sp.]|nr:tRNA adenosine deaminase-associated protein [Corynebacterium sp.]
MSNNNITNVTDVDNAEGYSFAVTATRGEGSWTVQSYADDFSNPKDALNAVRRLRAEGPAFALLCVDDDYFVVCRPIPGGARWFISDATMAVDDDFAADVLDEADAEFPDIDPEELDDAEPYADGDFEIFADLGLSEDQLAIIVEDEDDYPSDMLLRIAGDLGFGDELEEFMTGSGDEDFA